MKIVKKHKIKIILLFIFFLLIVFAVVGIINLLYPNSQKSIYGPRLEGIQNYDVNKSKLKDVASSLKEKEEVIKVSNSLSGRIINFIVTVKDETDLTISKSLTDIILEKFTEEEKGYFDFQVFIVSENAENELYPIIGYKHNLSSSLVWSN